MRKKITPIVCASILALTLTACGKDKDDKEAEKEPTSQSSPSETPSTTPTDTPSEAPTDTPTEVPVDPEDENTADDPNRVPEEEMQEDLEEQNPALAGERGDCLATLLFNSPFTNEGIEEIINSADINKAPVLSNPEDQALFDSEPYTVGYYECVNDLPRS